MAFVEKPGSGFVVKQGNVGRVLSRHKNRSDATARVAELHKKNKPVAAHKGASAKKHFGKKAKVAKAAGRKKPVARKAAKKK